MRKSLILLALIFVPANVFAIFEYGTTVINDTPHIIHVAIENGKNAEPTRIAGAEGTKGTKGYKTYKEFIPSKSDGYRHLFWNVYEKTSQNKYKEIGNYRTNNQETASLKGEDKGKYKNPHEMTITGNGKQYKMIEKSGLKILTKDPKFIDAFDIKTEGEKKSAEYKKERIEKEKAEKLKKEQDEKKKKEEAEAKKKQEAEAKKKAEEEAKKKQEEEKKRQEEKAKKEKEDEARRKIEEENRKKEIIELCKIMDSKDEFDVNAMYKLTKLAIEQEDTDVLVKIIQKSEKRPEPVQNYLSKIINQLVQTEKDYILSRLLENIIKNKRVNINIIDNNGNTPLHDIVRIYTQEKYSERRWALRKVIKELVTNGADLNFTNNQHKSPIDLAKELHGGYQSGGGETLFNYLKRMTR